MDQNAISMNAGMRELSNMIGYTFEQTQQLVNTGYL